MSQIDAAYKEIDRLRAEQLSLRDRLGEALVRENNLLAENNKLRRLRANLRGFKLAIRRRDLEIERLRAALEALMADVSDIAEHLPAWNNAKETK